MISHYKPLTFCLAGLFLFGATNLALGATVATDTTLANWGTYPDFQLSTQSPATVNTDNRLNSGFRTDMYQSFQVTSVFTLTEFDLHLQPFNETTDVRVRIYPITDTNAVSGSNPPGLGASLFDQTFDVATAGWSNFGSFNIQRFTLAGGEQFLMSPQTSPAGYILHLSYVGGTGSADPILRWSARTGNPYADGRTYFNTENASDYDQPLALFGAAPEAVPEPSTYSLGLIGLAGLGIVSLRKKVRRA